VHIDVEEKARSPLISGRQTMFATPGAVAELPLARAMRSRLVAAPGDAYAQAMKRAWGGARAVRHGDLAARRARVRAA